MPQLQTQVLVSSGPLKFHRRGRVHFNTMCHAKMAVQYAGVGTVYATDYGLRTDNSQRIEPITL